MKRSPGRRNSLSSSSKHSPRKLCVDTRSRSSRLLRGRTTSGTLCNRPRFSTSCNVQKFVNRCANRFDRGDHLMESFWNETFWIAKISLPIFILVRVSNLSNCFDRNNRRLETRNRWETFWIAKILSSIFIHVTFQVSRLRILAKENCFDRNREAIV